MKSKVLSLVLALTLLCSIMVPTAAFAAVDKGTEVVLSKDNFVAGTPGYILHKDTTLPVKDEPGSSIYGVPSWKIDKSYYVITPSIDLTKPFTFEYEYYAIDGVLTYFSFGDNDVFFTSDSGSTYLPPVDKTNPTGAIANFNAWNKVLFNYNGGQYGVYLNGVLIKSSRFSIAESATELHVGLYGQTLPAGSGYPEYIYIDEVYVYEDAYDPDGNPVETEEPVEPEDPVEPSEPEEDEEVTEATYIPVTTNNFKYNAGAQYGTSAEMRTMKDKADVNNSVPVIKFPKGQKVTVSGGKYPRFEITHGLTTTKSFTFMFDYFAHDIWTGFSLGTDDIFAVKNANGANTPVYYHDGSAFKSVSTTIDADKWHTVVFSYSKTTGMYSLYVDDICIATFNRTKTMADPTTIRIGTFLNSEPVEDDGGYIAVDNVYVYQDEYNPDIVLKEPEDVITITANAEAATVSASVNISDKYATATGDYCLWLATYDTTDGNNQLIGITCAVITDAGYQDLVITFEDSNAFSNVDYAQAFIWDKDYKPTGVYELLGTKPQ